MRGSWPGLTARPRPDPKGFTPVTSSGASLRRQRRLRRRFNEYGPTRSERGPAKDLLLSQAPFPVGHRPERGRGRQPARPGGWVREPEPPDVQEARPAEGSDADEPLLRELDADPELLR